MDEQPDAVLPSGVTAADPARALPPAGSTGPLHRGTRSIAGVLDRVGQDSSAEYLRGLDVGRAEIELQQRVQQVESHVRERPLASVFVAVAAGFILGRILRD